MQCIRTRIAGLCAAVLFVCASVFAGGGSASVGPSGAVLLGAPSTVYAPPWAPTNSYSQGATVDSSNVRYFAVIGGTSATEAPAGTADVNPSGGTVVWRHMLSGPRKGLYLFNNGSADVFVGWGARVTVDSPYFILSPGDKVLWSGLDDTPQGAVSAKSLTITNTVYAFEW